MNENVREIVLDILLEHETKNLKSHLLIRDVLDKYDYLDSKDKAFIKRVSEGTILNTITLDYVINRFSSKPVLKCKNEIRQILRMSVYQLLFMDKVPSNAICDEAVKLCKKRSFAEFTGFVNGVLRNIDRNKDNVLDFSSIENKSERLSLMYSCPEWIVKMFMKERHDAEALLKALTIKPATAVKVIDKDNEKEIIGAFKNLGITVEDSKYIKSAYLISGFEGVDSLPGFKEGKIIIQDQASMLAGEALGNLDGNPVIIDVCAAPGGKSTYTAAKLNGKGLVISRDLTDTKVSLINENIERLKLKNIKAQVFDATVLDEEMIEKADYLICDLPCSGLGVMGRKSDIRYNINNETMKELCDLQKTILSVVSKYLKVGGVMIYSTCTIHKAENEKMVKYIVENLPFRKDSLKPYLGKVFDIEREDEAYVQLLPNVDNTDGFFISRFIKTGHNE